MSATVETDSTPLTTPKSSKKRKNATETSQPSKKKRKQDKDEDGLTETQELTSKKKDRKKSKKEKLDLEVQVVPETQSTQETEDIEIPDAPEHTSPDVEAIADAVPGMNGTDSMDIVDEVVEEVDESLLQSDEPSCFYEKRLSLQLPIPAIALANPTTSILSLHLAPLLLTYFAPAEGIVLSFSDPILSATPNHGVNLPLKAPRSGQIPRVPHNETFARCADGHGSCWVWLTVTFMVFRPGRGDKLKGWTNVSSEGFVGLVSYNYFQTAVGKARIPKSWIWDGPTRENHRNRKKIRMGKLRDEEGINTSQDGFGDSPEPSQTYEASQGGSGTFVDEDGTKVPASQIFHVVDVEPVPAYERDRWTLQIDGSLLSEDAEAAVVAEERQRFEQIQNRSRSRSKTPGVEEGDMPLLSGDLPFGQTANSL